MAIFKRDADLYNNHRVIVPLYNFDGSATCNDCYLLGKQEAATAFLKEPVENGHMHTPLCANHAETKEVDAMFAWADPKSPDNSLQILVWKK
jgi:hypothetical protein